MISIESILNIVEEHVSSTEQLMETTEEHNANVDVIYNHQGRGHNTFGSKRKGKFLCKESDNVSCFVPCIIKLW